MKHKSTIAAAVSVVVAAAALVNMPERSLLDRSLVNAPDGGLKITDAGAILQSKEIHGVTTGDQGRGVVVFSPRATLHDVRFEPGSDDALGLVGDCRGALVSHCTFPLRWFGVNNPSKALICYTGPRSDEPGPMIGAEDGYAGTFIRNTFEGSAIRIRDGVWRFEGGSIAIGQLYGIDMVDPTRANIIGVDFRRLPQPPEAGYWTGVQIRLLRHAGGKYLQTSLKSRLFIANCTIDGRPATPQEICPGVPDYVFAKVPLTR